MGVIFDLDQTLIQSDEAIELRRIRRWNEVYRIIPRLTPFDGINDLISKLNVKGIPICIVTSSPSSYCNRVINQWGWQNIKTVCYHDTKMKKPHPEPIQKAIKLLEVPQSQIVSIGDDPKDIIASKRANVLSIGALWGCNNKCELIASSPDYIFTTVQELDAFLSNNFKL
ncbi:MAG: HAD family hydrolase [Clostridiales bacterium]|jgi:HAD superfamily hydrolase (TIGR01549 family)|nr:HAD family hydrolase [Clostridiales bacterium]